MSEGATRHDGHAAALRRALLARPLLWCFALALAVRAVAVLFYAQTTPGAVIWEYGEQGLCAVQTHGDLCLRDRAGAPYLSAYMPPLTSYLWSALFAVFGQQGGAHVAYVTLNALAGALAAPLLFLFGRRAGFGKGESLLAAAILAVYPTFVFVSAGYHATNFTVVCALALAVLLADALRSQRMALFFAAGVAAGLAALTRSEFVPIGAALGLVILWRLRPFRNALLSAALFGIGAAVVVAPWTVRNYVVFERIIPVANSQGYNLWKAFGPYSRGSGNEVEIVARREIDATAAAVPLGDEPGDRYENRIQDAFAAKMQQGLARRSLLGELQLAASKAALLVAFDWTDPLTHRVEYWLPWLVLNALAIAGMVALARGEWRRLRLDGAAVALVLVLGMAGAYVISGVHARYRMHIEPFEFLIAAVGAFTLARTALRGSRD